MTLQLLCRFDASGSWKSDYDDGAETRSNAGLSQLQLWRDADGGSAVWALYSVNDRDKAQGWLEGQAKLGPAVAEAHFLETA